MKKIFTLLSLVTLFVLTANAAGDGYRRTWDFREGWSATTLDILAQDTKHWKATDNGFENTKNFSELKAVMTYNGEDIPIPELEGLTLGAMKSAAHVQIASKPGNGATWPDGLQCLWINGKNSADYIEFVVPAGENVKIGYCSHKDSEERGFKTSAGFADAAGNTTFKSKGDGTVHEVELINPNTTESTLKLSSTSGHHIYYIIIGEGDVPQISKVGYFYEEADAASIDELPLYAVLKDMEKVEFAPVKVGATAPTKDELMAYDVVVLDGGLTAGEALVASLKENIQWQPVVNFNPELAVALGYGEAAEEEAEFGFAMDADSKYMKGFAAYLDEESHAFSLTNGEVMGVPLNLTAHAGDEAIIAHGSFGDTVYAETPIAYARNANHNAYIYYGVSGDYHADTKVILHNIVAAAAATKSDITPTPDPSFKGDYSEMQATVTISCLNKNAVIYYTIDGTEPTTASAVYTEPILFTTEAVVKAVAVAEGYTISGVNSFDVKLFHQAKAPVVTVEGDETKGDVLVTLTQEDGADIWYNFTGSEDTLKSTKYDAPITLKAKAEISVFAVSDDLGLVQSELVTETIKANMLNVRRDELAHFNASGWNTLENLYLDGEQMTAWASSNYYFTWGKNAVESFEQSGDEPLKDENGEILEDENGNWIYPTVDRPASVTTNVADSAWQLTSRGQVMIHQTNTLTENVGDGGGYNPERAEDLIGKWGTKNDIQFGGVASGDKPTATIQSRNKYAGPFNVIAVVANVSSGAQVAVQVSKDSVEWETVGDVLNTPTVKRLYKTFEVSYDGTEEVYVRLASIKGSSQAVHDIYVLNNGEKSKAEEQEYATGIEEVKTSETAAPVKVKKVVMNGKLVIVTPNGTFNVAGVQVR